MNPTIYIATALNGSLSGYQIDSIKESIRSFENINLNIITAQSDNERILVDSLTEDFKGRIKTTHCLGLNSLYPSKELALLLKKIKGTILKECSLITDIAIITGRKHDLFKLFNSLVDQSGKPTILVTNFVLVNYILYCLYSSKLDTEKLLLPGTIATINGEKGLNFVRDYETEL